MSAPAEPRCALVLDGVVHCASRACARRPARTASLRPRPPRGREVYAVGITRPRRGWPVVLAACELCFHQHQPSLTIEEVLSSKSPVGTLTRGRCADWTSEWPTSLHASPCSHRNRVLDPRRCFGARQTTGLDGPTDGWGRQYGVCHFCNWPFLASRRCPSCTAQRPTASALSVIALAVTSRTTAAMWRRPSMCNAGCMCLSGALEFPFALSWRTYQGVASQV